MITTSRRRRTSALFRAVEKMVLKITAALVIGGLLIMVPLPPAEPIVTGRAALVSFLIVIYIGKTIYDTLFYNRYVP